MVRLYGLAGVGNVCTRILANSARAARSDTAVAFNFFVQLIRYNDSTARKHPFVTVGPAVRIFSTGGQVRLHAWSTVFFGVLYQDSSSFVCTV